MRATPVPQKKKTNQKKTAREAGNPRTAKKKNSYVDTGTIALSMQDAAELFVLYTKRFT